MSKVKIKDLEMATGSARVAIREAHLRQPVICILSVIDPILKDQIATLFGCMGIRGGCPNFTLVARKGLLLL